MEKKPLSFSFFFKRLNRKANTTTNSNDNGNGNRNSSKSSGGAWRWKLKSSSGLRWKRRFNLHLWFIDSILFKIVSVFEAIVLVSTLCVFFLCCGCHF